MKKLLFSLTLAFLAGSAYSQKLYTENWDNGKKKCEGTLYGATEFSKTESKEEIAMKMANSLKDGKWLYWYDSGKPSGEENYKMGKEIGVWKTWYLDGKVSSEIDFETGLAVYFYPTGKKQSEGGMLKGMLKTGTWTGYFENGQKNYEGRYKDGVKDGKWLWYNEKGEETVTENFKAGVKEAPKSN